MRFHRFRAKMQQLGDLTYLVGFADRLEEFKFAIAQSLDSVYFASA